MRFFHWQTVDSGQLHPTASEPIRSAQPNSFTAAGKKSINDELDAIVVEDDGSVDVTTKPTASKVCPLLVYLSTLFKLSNVAFVQSIRLFRRGKGKG